MVLLMMAAGDQAEAGGARGAGLHAVEALDAQQAVGVRPGDGSLRAVLGGRLALVADGLNIAREEGVLQRVPGEHEEVRRAGRILAVAVRVEVLRARQLQR